MSGVPFLLNVSEVVNVMQKHKLYLITRSAVVSGANDLKRCRGAVAEVQRCRGGAEVQW